jgi:hypothetical protein
MLPVMKLSLFIDMVTPEPSDKFEISQRLDVDVENPREQGSPDITPSSPFLRVGEVG